ncbi:MAG: hypothetical protein A3C58_00700 [Candidatus Staskawiczbacteria bacterium RIFCSPHIGHO2_02_FULL_34_10]|uniref:Transcription elongation factor GreA/GreB C-terminal domain-containing protein n=1 Tax=Candidatus Staskawiczbacteria bacterium RIFCSPHIGHO2_02_FULL_34_10 TaxID=1802205 RepID=A0A1G2HUR0_9BACT|nr:MAG: hypothetical protein A3C58_00700 [Candidatus Staskawiczbacteria bacterium RIFCSPHIGHO2_02_FULL_34_10]
MKKLLNTYKRSNSYKKSQLLVVGVGKKVEIKINGETQFWEIVDIGKSDIEDGKISFNAPLIQSILGAKKGDKFAKKLMGNKITVVIKNISFNV